jgi:S1-C subfamily serine protease
MKKLLLCLLLVSCSKSDMIRNMVNSVVKVDESSGVVIYAKEPTAFVLTSYHVVADNAEDNTPISIVSTFESFSVPYNAGFYDAKLDLALLQITYRGVLYHSEVAVDNPLLGDDIWLAANPNHYTKSLKKGIISSTARVTNGGDLAGWEVSGGIIFGSSGGGAFNMSGELFGVIRAVDSYSTDFCQADDEDVECLRIALPDMGIVVPPDQIRGFILASPYSSYFNYLKE